MRCDVDMQPRGKGSLPAGSPVTALVIDPLPSAPVSQSFFSAAAGLDDYTAAQLRGEALKAAADYQPSSGGSVWMLVSPATPHCIYVIRTPKGVQKETVYYSSGDFRGLTNHQ